MYVFIRPTNKKDAVAILGMFVLQMVIYCILKGAKECGKN